MKEYGLDLKKQYEKSISSSKHIVEKIKKRRAFLIKKATQELLKSTGLEFNETDNVSVMLDEIMAIENAYVKQSAQLDMFKGK